MSPAGSNSNAATELVEQPARGSDGSFRLLTFNLGLLGFELNRRWRLPIDTALKQRLAAAPDLLSAIDADIIALQEVYTEVDREFLVRAMASRYPFTAAAPRMYSAVGNGLMLLSRFPILRSEFIPCHGAPAWMQLFWKQGFLKADIDLPGGRRISLINLHFAVSVPLSRADSAASLSNRVRETTQLLQAAGTGELPTILIGDFNASLEVYPQGYRRILEAGYVDAFTAANGTNGAVTWDAENPLNRQGRFQHSPSQRIDHVFVSDAGSPRLAPVSAQIVLQEKVLRTSAGDAIPLSDHYGLLATVMAQAPLNRRTSHEAAGTADPA